MFLWTWRKMCWDKKKVKNKQNWERLWTQPSSLKVIYTPLSLLDKHWNAQGEIVKMVLSKIMVGKELRRMCLHRSHSNQLAWASSVFSETSKESVSPVAQSAVLDLTNMSGKDILSDRVRVLILHHSEWVPFFIMNCVAGGILTTQFVNTADLMVIQNGSKIMRALCVILIKENIQMRSVIVQGFIKLILRQRRLLHLFVRIDAIVLTNHWNVRFGWWERCSLHLWWRLLCHQRCVFKGVWLLKFLWLLLWNLILRDGTKMRVTAWRGIPISNIGCILSIKITHEWIDVMLGNINIVMMAVVKVVGNVEFICPNKLFALVVIERQCLSWSSNNQSITIIYIAFSNNISNNRKDSSFCWNIVIVFTLENHIRKCVSSVFCNVQEESWDHLISWESCCWIVVQYQTGLNQEKWNILMSLVLLYMTSIAVWFSIKLFEIHWWTVSRNEAP